MLTVKESDTHKVSWGMHEVDEDGNIGPEVDLTGATAEIMVRKIKGDARMGPPWDGPAISLVGTVVDNRVQHVLTGTLAPGRYALQITVSKAGEETTGPTRNSDVLVVTPDLED